MGPMYDMCHHLIGRKSKVMDKVIKEIQESQWESDKWQDEDIPLDFGPNNSVEKEMGEEKEREKREHRKRREKLQFLFTIYRYRWVGFRQTKN